MAKGPAERQERLETIKYYRILGLRGRRLKDLLLRIDLKEDRRLRLQETLEEPVVTNTTPEINHDWIMGETCSGNFQKLKRFERSFLFMVYHEGSVQRAAEQLGLSDRTTRRLIGKIADTLRS